MLTQLKYHTWCAIHTIYQFLDYNKSYNPTKNGHICRYIVCNITQVTKYQDSFKMALVHDKKYDDLFQVCIKKYGLK